MQHPCNCLFFQYVNFSQLSKENSEQFRWLWDSDALSAQHKHLETLEEDLMENVGL